MKISKRPKVVRKKVFFSRSVFFLFPFYKFHWSRRFLHTNHLTTKHSWEVESELLYLYLFRLIVDPTPTDARFVEIFYFFEFSKYYTTNDRIDPQQRKLLQRDLSVNSGRWLRRYFSCQSFALNWRTDSFCSFWKNYPLEYLIIVRN